MNVSVAVNVYVAVSLVVKVSVYVSVWVMGSTEEEEEVVVVRLGKKEKVTVVGMQKAGKSCVS